MFLRNKGGFMKVKVNEEECIGCGACVSLCPEVFDFNDEGYATAKEEKISEELTQKVIDALESCPVDAIKRND